MSADEAFREIAGAMEGVVNPAQRVGLATQIFGKQGTALLPVLANGKEGLAEMAAEADRLGVTIKAADASKIEAANDAIDRAKAAFTGAANAAAVQLAPVLETVANKIVAFATEGEGMGGKVMNAFRGVVSSVAYASDYLSLATAGFKLLQSGATLAVYSVVKSIDVLGSGIVGLLNLLPGVELEWTDFTGQLADGLLDEAQQLKDEAGDAFGNFMDNANSAGVNKWFDDLQSKADETAQKIGDAAKGPRIAPEVDADAMEKVRDTLDGITKDTLRVGMNDNQRKLADLVDSGATPEQIAQAKELLDLQTRLEGLQKPTTTTDYAAAMENLQSLYAAGKVTADQFANIRATASASLNETLTDQARQLTEELRTPLESYQSEIARLNDLFERGLIDQTTLDRATLKARDTLNNAGGTSGENPAAIRAGSQAAARFAYDNAKGPARLNSQTEYAKAQLKETEKQTKSLDTIARNTTANSGGITLEEVEL